MTWRTQFRAGLVRPTAGLAPGFAQANLIAVPREWAWDVSLYGQRNPQPCPVLDVGDPGVPRTVLAPGAPVYVGDPAGLGIADLEKLDFGDAVPVMPGEVPVFWACGVTPQAAVMASGVPYAVTHAPGHMLITDVPDTRYQV